MSNIRSWVREHPVWSYFLLAFALSWAAWIPMALVGATAAQGRAWPTHLPGLFGPLVAAFVMAAIAGGRPTPRGLAASLVKWRVHWKWYAVAFSPLAFYALAALALALLGRGWPDFAEMGKFSSLPVVAAPVMWLLLLATSFGEEAGWRGYAVPRLLAHRSFLATALVIGVLWATWHAPSFFVIENYQAMSLATIPTFALGIVAGSVLLTWLYRETGGSVLLVSLWHATYNLVSGTAVATGLPAAIVSTAVMAWAAVIGVVEWRRARAAPRVAGSGAPGARGGGA